MWALMMVQEENWRESFHVLSFVINQNFFVFLAATPGFQSLHDPSRQITGRSLEFLFNWFWIFFGLVNIRSPLIAHQPQLTQLLERCHSQFVPLFLESEFHLLEVIKMSWKKMLSNVLKVSSKLMSQIQKTNLTILAPQSERISPFCTLSVTIDPFVRPPIFIENLSERQYCWRIFEDFHCQEYTQFFDIHNCLFMRLHFSIGGYDYRRTTRLRQSRSFFC